MDAMEKEPQKSTSQMIKDKVIGPEKVEPTSRVAKQLQDKKKASARRRMLINTDEDSDEEGNITTNPVAKQDTESMKYNPPPLNLAINDGSSSVATSRIDRVYSNPLSSVLLDRRPPVASSRSGMGAAAA